MTDQRWPSVDRVLQAALDRPPQEREAFVRTACAGDVALRDEVLSLLAHTASAGDFLEVPSTERVQLAAGSRLGGYEVRERIGSGGMGDVYRATDAKLRRDIALKVLPPDAADAGRRDRFAREAQAIAALNHPAIVTIHSVEEDGGVHFLTMELVQGRTLAEVISPGGLPLKRLLEIAIPLADAIGAAHSRGIVHRDIKPANVMVTRDGRIKVLDFGLAKLKAPEALTADATTLVHGPPTREGSIVGTCAYMSPEQAEGREVDHRSDVFSLGVLIYELASGVRPFKGDSTITVLAAIVKDTPVPLVNVRPDLPAGLSRIVSRCLAKAPGRRYQSVLDLRNDLEELQEGLSVGTATAPASASRPVRRRTVIAVAAAVIVMIAAGYLFWRTQSPKTAVAEFQRSTIAPPSGVQIAPQNASPLLAISPDGRWIAFHGSSSDPDRAGLYLRSTSEIEPRRIRDGNDGSPFFSSDSKWLGFWSKDVLWRVPVAGGAAERICEVKGGLRGASWGDNNQIVFSVAEGVFRVSGDGGSPAPLIAADGKAVQFYFPHVLPGSKSVLVTQRVKGEPTLVIVSLTTGEVIRRWTIGSSPQYADVDGGWLVFRRSTRLYAAPFDLDRLDMTGEARPVFADVSFNEGGSQTSAFALSRTGALVYVPAPPPREAAQLTWLDSRGGEGPVAGEKQDYSWPTLDPRGERIAVHVTKSDQTDLWVYDIRTQAWRWRTRGLSTGRAMAWTGDGKWIVFSSIPFGVPSLFRVGASDGEPYQLTSLAEYGRFTSVYDVATSAFGNVASFFRQVGLDDFDLLTISVDPPGPPEPFLKTDFLAADGQIAPNGHWIAYAARREFSADDNNQVVVRSYPDGVKPVPIQAPGANPRWSRDGRQLFFRRGRAIWSVSFVSRGSSPTVGIPQLVLTMPPDVDLEQAKFDVAPDGRFLVVKRPLPTRTERLLVYVHNWLAAAHAAYANSK